LLDLQVVERNRRSYAFSLDSFEIILDPLLCRMKNSTGKIVVNSAFGDYEDAVKHLQEGIIVTRNPELIHRGVFRYVLERAKGRLPQAEDQGELERLFVNQLKEEFGEENSGVDYFSQILTKFVLKHKKDSDKILTEMNDLLSRFIKVNEDGPVCGGDEDSTLRNLIECVKSLSAKRTSDSS